MDIPNSEHEKKIMKKSKELAARLDQEESSVGMNVRGTVFLERVALSRLEPKLRELDKNYSFVYTEMSSEGRVNIYVLKKEKDVYDDFLNKTKAFEKEMIEKLKPLLGARACITIIRKIKI